MKGLKLFICILISSVTLYGQGSGTPSTLRVLVDANGYLVVSVNSQTLPLSQPTVFSNTRLKTDASGYLQVVVSGGGFAPADATYIVQTPSASLSAEQALSALTSGLLFSTTTTGVITSLTSVAAGQVLVSNGTGIIPIYSTSPSLTTLTLSTSDILGTNPFPASFGGEGDNHYLWRTGWDQNSFTGAIISNTNTGINARALFSAFIDSTTAGVDMVMYSVNATNHTWAAKAGAFIGETGVTRLVVGTLGASPLNFITTDTTRMTIDPTGEIGINRAPITGVKLSVEGQTFVNAALFVGTALGSGSHYIEGWEQSADPTAPAANAGRIFFKDNGAGKTQLCVRFNSGATQCFATEP